MDLPIKKGDKINVIRHSGEFVYEESGLFEGFVIEGSLIILVVSMQYFIKLIRWESVSYIGIPKEARDEKTESNL